jgi:fumarate reductase flavoprotein subunit
MRDYDVVVIGSGAAGLSAAVAARDAGAEVLVCEAGDRVGGTSANSGGLFLAAGTELQRRQGVADSPDALFEHFMVANKWELEPAVVRRFVDDGPSALEWLISLGVEFLPTIIPVGQSSVPRGHVPKGWGHSEITALQAAASGGGVDISLSTRVERLLTDTSGRVVGISAEGTEVRCGAVVVACGGIGNASDEILREYWPDACRHGADWHYYIGVETNRGDAIKLGRAVGAEIGGKNNGLMVGVSAYHGAIEGPPPGWPLLVNIKGRRFANELLDYSILGHNINRQPKSVAYGIFDHAAFTRTADDPRYKFSPILEAAPGYAWTPDNLREGFAKGKIVSAPDFTALAKKCGIDAATLVATMNEYNQDARAGRDRHFLKDPRSLVPVETPPFYAMERRAAERAVSFVGLHIDADARVYSEHGTYVQGLFAAGEAASGIVNYYVATGNSIASCVIFGRAAGRNAAAERLHA